MLLSYLVQLLWALGGKACNLVQQLKSDTSLLLSPDMHTRLIKWSPPFCGHFNKFFACFFLMWGWVLQPDRGDGGWGLVNYHIRNINDSPHLHLYEERSHEQYSPLISLNVDTHWPYHSTVLSNSYCKGAQNSKHLLSFTLKGINVGQLWR